MIILTILVTYVAVLLLLYFVHGGIIFHPEKLPDGFLFNAGLGGEEVFLDTEDGERINGIYYPGSKRELVLYFHGNAGDLSNWQYVSQDFVKAGYHFFIIDYRGYGKSSGRITESGLYADASAAHGYVTATKGFSPDEIIIYGRSIGSGVAVDLAAKKNVKGLVLEAPYASLTSLANQKAPWMLPSLILRYRFDNLAKINDVNCPVLFLHGSEDALIPPTHGQRLFDKFKGKKELVIIDGGSHNDLESFPAYHNALKDTMPLLFGHAR